jgi:hypothetical protein
MLRRAAGLVVEEVGTAEVAVHIAVHIAERIEALAEVEVASLSSCAVP